MINKIDTVTARNKLKIRREPYWQRISKGFYVGFRKMTDGSSGTWLLRHRPEIGNEVENSLGTLDQYKAHERFDKAVEAARDWLLRAAAMGDTDVSRHATTLWDACNAYVNKIRDDNSS